MPAITMAAVLNLLKPQHRTDLKFHISVILLY